MSLEASSKRSDLHGDTLGETTDITRPNNMTSKGAQELAPTETASPKSKVHRWLDMTSGTDRSFNHAFIVLFFDRKYTELLCFFYDGNRFFMIQNCC